MNITKTRLSFVPLCFGLLLLVLPVSLQAKTLADHDFSSNQKPNGTPHGWWGDMAAVSYVSEEGEQMLKISRPAEEGESLKGFALIHTREHIPAGVSKIKITTRMNAEDLVEGPKPFDTARLLVVAEDANQKAIAYLDGTKISDADKDGVRTNTLDLPAGTESVKLSLGFFGSRGVFFVREIELESVEAE